MTKDDSEDQTGFTNAIKRAEERINRVLTKTTATNVKVFQNEVFGQINKIQVDLIDKADKFTKKEMADGYKTGEKDADKVIERAPKEKKVLPPLIKTPKMAVLNPYIELASNIKIASKNAIDIVNKSIKAVEESGRMATVAMIRDEIKNTMATENGNALNVTYKNGSKVGLSQYSDMLARTSRIQTENEGMIARTKQIGRDLVICTDIASSCPICRKFEGKVYSISGKDKRFPPLYTGANAPFRNGYNIIHPNCRHEFLPFIEELHTEKEVADLQKRSNHFENYTGKEKIFDGYRKEQSQLRQWRAETIEYDEMKTMLGDNMPYKTLGGFRRAKRAGSSEYTETAKKLNLARTEVEKCVL